MSDENSASGEGWTEVGDQFQALGEGIAEALRATWEREETRQHVSDLQAGLEALVGNVDRAIREFGDTPEGQRLRSEANRAAGSARIAGENAWQDAQPHIVSALRQVTAEFRKVASKLGDSEVDSASSSAETS